MDVKRIRKIHNRSRSTLTSGFSISKISLFKSIENNHYAYRGKTCMKKFCECLGEYAIETIVSRKKKTKVINKKTSRNHTKISKYVIFIKKKLEINVLKIIKISES